MSDAKRPPKGDISDLKARLGLKKGGAPSGSGTTGQIRTNGQSGGVVAPPGMNLPPPPGVPQQHSQPQPVMPNAADDPFGAMNAMAAVGTVQRAPEIVIVNDGRPVENVGSSSTGATIAKLAVPAVIALIIGVVVGKIGAGASSYNAGLADAKAILGDKSTPSTISSLKQQLSSLDTLLDEAKTQNSFKPDAALDKQLEAIVQKLDVKSEIVFRAKQNSLDAEVSGQIVSFYAGVAEVKSMLDTHIKSAKSDDLAFKKAKDKGAEGQLKETDNANLAGQLRYAILIQAPTESDKVDFGAKVVEIGPPYCGERLATSGKCPEGEQPSGYAYRADPGATWTKGDLAAGGSDSVPTKRLVLLLPGGVRDSLVRGAEGVASETFYQRRLKAIYERIRGLPNKPNTGLLDEGNKLETRMQTEASKSSRFSFGM